MRIALSNPRSRWGGVSAAIALGRSPERRAELGRNGQARARTRFSRERLVADYEALLDRVIMERRK